MNLLRGEAKEVFEGVKNFVKIIPQKNCQPL